MSEVKRTRRPPRLKSMRLCFDGCATNVILDLVGKSMIAAGAKASEWELWKLHALRRVAGSKSPAETRERLVEVCREWFTVEEAA